MAPRRLAALFVLLATLVLPSLVPPSLGPSAAEAQTDRAAAQALFDEALTLRDRGDFEAACAKFEESLRLDAAVGTRFNLADCMERIGRYATAWSHFLEVVATTEMAGQDARADAARARAQKLQPRLARLRIAPVAPVMGLEIKRNGVVVGQAQWDTPMPVDEGSYHVEATAPGKLPFEGTVDVRGEGNVVRFEVPGLVDAPTPAPGAVPGSMPVGGMPPRGDDGVSGTTIAGITLASIGAVGLGVGAVFGIIAMGKKGDVDDLCPDETRCTQEGIDTNDEAKAAGNIATIGFIAGGALLAGGLVLWLAFPSGGDSAAADASTAPSVALAPGHADGPGLTLIGRF